MLRLFDTHCHFESADSVFIASVLKRARMVGVERIVAVGCNDTLNASAQCALRLAKRSERESYDAYPQVFAAAGFDYEQADKVNVLVDTETTSSFVAWGEIGLDYHYSPETRNLQLAHFAKQLQEAHRRNLPVIIHTRDADDDTLGTLRDIPSRGVIHCFTGTPDFARKLLDLGFFISFSGIVTFRAADNVRQSAKFVPDGRILIETDAPFLAPVPKRGLTNEPAFIEYTCRTLADLRGALPEFFADLTYANASRLFCLDGD